VRLLAAFPHVPWPPLGGGVSRSWHLSSRLAARHEVHVFALASPGESPPPADAPLPYASIEVVPIPGASPPRWSAAWLDLRLRSLRRPAAAYHTTHAAQRFAQRVAAVRPDVILYGMSWMLPYAREAPGIPAVVDEQNYDPQIAARMAESRHGLDAAKWRVYAWLNRRAERRALQTVRAIAACSEIDARLFRVDAPHARVVVVPNGVDLQTWTPSPQGDAVVMTGSFVYEPNRDGARWLVREAWPRVLAAQPGAQLRLVGLGGAEALADLAAAPGVTLVGTVPDMRPEMRRARLAVAPLLAGSGTRIKILEAFGAARPVVTTTIGAEGLAVTDGTEVFVRDDPAGFAEAIVRLLRDESLAQRMGAAGRALAESRYDWRVAADAMDALLRQVAG
jgi:glycosyltransferase involved in cell wall biosynthesis